MFALSLSISGTQGGNVPDFTGWSAGSEAGVYTDGVTGGKFPTGCVCEADGAVVTIDEATHDAAGVECITLTVEIAEAGEVTICFPSLLPAIIGQVWRAYLHIASIQINDVEAAAYGVAEFDGDDNQLDFNAEPFAEGLNDIDVTLSAPDTAQVAGMISIESSVPSSLTISLALKLEQVV